MSAYLDNLEKFRQSYQKLNFQASVESTSMGLMAPVLCRVMNAKTAVEIGAAYGWITQCLCAGIEAVAGKDGVLISVDLEPSRHEELKKLTASFDIQSNVICGDSTQVDWAKELKAFDRTEIDIASIDGNHLGDVPLIDLRNVLDLMSPTGVILMHDYGHMYDDVVTAVNTILGEEEWRLFQLPQNKTTNETGCCILQRDQFLDVAPGTDDRPVHITEYEETISTKTLDSSKLSQQSLKQSAAAPRRRPVKFI